MENKLVATHDGAFHADDVFAVATGASGVEEGVDGAEVKVNDFVIKIILQK